MLLAIDTATHLAGLALYEQGRVWAEESWHSAMTHTVELMPRVQRMLRTCRVSVDSLAGLAVSLGPGSFTGLRIGLAAAKGMALPHRLPVIGIPTLDAAAYPFQGSGQPVWAIIRAGRGRIAVACYDTVGQMWTQTSPPTLTTFEGLCKLNTGPAVFTGELDEGEENLLRERLGNAATIPSPAMRLRRPAWLAELAAARLSQNDVDDVATLSPIYLQHPVTGG
ncbi:MAG: tRNA (adenosine(37)-N6)-threonylcarbamoyltransferase complex dimerization subunit type 1 TsaB [Anaerolineae bacterium]